MKRFMALWHRTRFGVLALYRRKVLRQELDEELTGFLETSIDEKLKDGMSPGEARRTAVLELGGKTRIVEECHDQWGLRWAEEILKDLRFGLRKLVRNPVSTGIVLLILSLGIGGTTAVVSVADKVLLSPIPGRATDRLVSLSEIEVTHNSRWHVSPVLIEEIARHTNLVRALTYCYNGPEKKTWEGGERSSTVLGARVAPNFFDLLGLRPLAGRTFRPGEGGNKTGLPIVISYGLWQAFFGRDPGILDQGIKLDGEQYSVVGIMPASIQFPFGEGYSQFWIPYVFDIEQLRGDWGRRDRMWMSIVQLQNGVTLSEFQSMLDAIGSRRAESLNEPNQHWIIEARPARLAFSGEQLEKTIWSLLAMMGLFLVIACANVGNLLLARTLSRHGEFGIRLAIGAGRWRLARQLLIESLSLAGIAAALALLVAWASMDVLGRFYLASLPRINVIGLDWGVFRITGLVALGSSILFGAAPAWLAARTSISRTMHESATHHSSGRHKRFFQESLVVIQVCVAVALLAGAGLLTRSVVNVLRVRPGMDAKGLYRVTYDASEFWDQPAAGPQTTTENGVSGEEGSLKAWRETVNRWHTFQRIGLERLHAVTGVESAAVTTGAGFHDHKVEGREELLSLGSVGVSVIHGNYLRTVAAELVLGRLLTEEDGQPGKQGVVINEEMAAVVWPGENPLGKRFRQSDKNADYEVVGLIRNIQDWRLDAKVKPTFYEPYERGTQYLPAGLGEFNFRSSLDPEMLRAGLVEAGLDMLFPVELREFYSIERQLNRSTAPRRIMMWLVVSLSVLGLLFSALGVYAVLAYSVSQRTREIGIRVAMGADRSQIRGLFLRHGLRLLGNGLLLGLVLAFTGTQYIKSLLFGVQPVDPGVMVIVLLLIGCAGGIACWLPASRAAKLNPMVALRAE